jgi:hypothetical protein
MLKDYVPMIILLLSLLSCVALLLIFFPIAST